MKAKGSLKKQGALILSAALVLTVFGAGIGGERVSAKDISSGAPVSVTERAKEGEKVHRFQTTETEFTVSVPEGFEVHEKPRREVDKKLAPSLKGDPREGVELWFHGDENNQIFLFSSEEKFPIGPFFEGQKRAVKSYRSVQGLRIDTVMVTHEEKEGETVFLYAKYKDALPTNFGAIIRFQDKRLFQENYKTLIETLKSLTVFDIIRYEEPREAETPKILKKEKTHTFKTEESHFTVQVPKGWEIFDRPRAFLDTKRYPFMEPDPEEGVELRLNGDEKNRITIFSRLGSISIDPGFGGKKGMKKSFRTRDGKKVETYMPEESKRGYLEALYSGNTSENYGASVNFEDGKVFRKKYKEIIKILKSLKMFQGKE